MVVKRKRKTRREENEDGMISLSERRLVAHLTEVQLGRSDLNAHCALLALLCTA